MFTGISLWIPQQISITRTIDIKSSKQKVLEDINDLQLWDKWNKFTGSPLLAHKKYSNPSSGVGASMQSDQLSVFITGNKSDSVKTAWKQYNGKQFNGTFVFAEIRPGETVVQWYLDFRFKWYPWEKFSALVYNSQIGTVMDESLTALKRFAENNP